MDMVKLATETAFGLNIQPGKLAGVQLKESEVPPDAQREALKGRLEKAERLLRNVLECGNYRVFGPEIEDFFNERSE